MNERRSKIRGFFLRYFQGRELGDEEDVFKLGFVNSLLAMQLVTFVEKEFAITVEDDDLDLDNFRSVAAIEELIERKSVDRGQAVHAGE